MNVMTKTDQDDKDGNDGTLGHNGQRFRRPKTPEPNPTPKTDLASAQTFISGERSLLFLKKLLQPDRWSVCFTRGRNRPHVYLGRAFCSEHDRLTTADNGREHAGEGESDPSSRIQRRPSSQDRFPTRRTTSLSQFRSGRGHSANLDGSRSFVLLGKGAFGAVYLANDPRLDRQSR